MPFPIILRLEERIIQRDRLNAPHIRVIHKIRVNVKEHGHIHRLTSIQPLLLKAETLNLAEIWRYLARTDRICGYANDVGVRVVGRGVEGEGCFAREDADFALLRGELPGEDVGGRALEGDAESRDISDRSETGGRVCKRVAAVVANGCASPTGLLADLEEDV